MPPFALRQLLFAALLLAAPPCVGGAAAEPAPARTVYLSFDDGPLGGTERILGIVGRHGIRVSMMLTGLHALGGPSRGADVARAKADPLVFVANHGFTHAWRQRYAAFYAHPRLVLADFEASRATLGLEERIARLPGRNVWLVGTRARSGDPAALQAAQVLGAAGYRVFGWDVYWANDAAGRSRQTVAALEQAIEAAAAAAFTPGHVVVVAHDQMFRRAESGALLDDLVGRLKRRQWRFEGLDRYPAAQSAQRAPAP